MVTIEKRENPAASRLGWWWSWVPTSRSTAWWLSVIASVLSIVASGLVITQFAK